MLRILGFLSFISGCLVMTPKVLSTPSYAWEILPVRILEESSNNIRVSYQEVCHGTFDGFLIRSQANGSLKIGVMIRRSHARCAALPGMRNLTVPHLKASDFPALTSISPADEPSQMGILPLQNMHSFVHKDTAEWLATYTSNCGQSLGLFLQPRVDATHVGVVESLRNNKTPCTRSTKTVKIRGIKSGLPPMQFNPIGEEENHAPFHLRRITVQIDQNKMQNKGEAIYQIRFHRRCNEAPIGLIRQQQASHTIELSMLVAYYPSMPCPNNSPRSLASFWGEDFRTSNKNLVVAAHLPKHRETLRLARPLSYQWIPSSTHPKLKISGYSSCTRNLGLVTRDSDAGVAAGILQLLSSKPCNSTLDKVSYGYEWNSTASLKRDVKPLQLLGSY